MISSLWREARFDFTETRFPPEAADVLLRGYRLSVAAASSGARLNDAAVNPGFISAPVLNTQPQEPACLGPTTDQAGAFGWALNKDASEVNPGFISAEFLNGKPD